MSNFTFDLPLLASITIAAPDAETARQILQAALDCANTNFGAFPNGNPILGECSLMEDINLYRHLGMVDGIDCANQYGRRVI